MNSNEVLIQIRPTKHVAMVKCALEQFGFKVTGEGNMLTADLESVRDVWLEIPPGSHPDEYTK